MNCAACLKKDTMQPSSRLGAYQVDTIHPADDAFTKEDEMTVAAERAAVERGRANRWERVMKERRRRFYQSGVLFQGLLMGAASLLGAILMLIDRAIPAGTLLLIIMLTGPFVGYMTAMTRDIRTIRLGLVCAVIMLAFSLGLTIASLYGLGSLLSMDPPDGCRSSGKLYWQGFVKECDRFLVYYEIGTGATALLVVVESILVVFLYRLLRIFQHLNGLGVSLSPSTGVSRRTVLVGPGSAASSCNRCRPEVASAIVSPSREATRCTHSRCPSSQPSSLSSCSSPSMLSGEDHWSHPGTSDVRFDGVGRPILKDVLRHDSREWAQGAK